MKKGGLVLILALVLGVTIIIGGPTRTVAADKPIIVGFAIAKSGWMEPYDYGSRTAEFAIADINASGGLLGRQIKSVYADNKTDPSESAKAGLEMVEKEADLVVVSCDYDIGAPAALSAVNAGKLAISLCAGDPKMGIEGVGRLAFTAAHAGQAQGAAIGDWVYHKKNFRTAYILLDVVIEYSKSVAQGFEYHWKNLPGTKLLGKDTFKNADPSISAQITRIKNLPQKPDVIMLSSFMPGGASAMRQLRAAGVNTPLVLPFGSDGTYWLGAIPDLSDVYLPAAGTVSINDPNPRVEKIRKHYKEVYGEHPATSYVYFGYALIEMWAKAVERAKTTDAKAVVAELEKFKNEATVIGPVSFSDKLHIQNKGRFLIMGIKKGVYQQFGYWDSPEIPKSELFRH